jgi:hypothetical protein
MKRERTQRSGDRALVIMALAGGWGIGGLMRCLYCACVAM